MNTDAIIRSAVGGRADGDPESYPGAATVCNIPNAPK
jgi:hypothetical protein